MKVMMAVLIENQIVKFTRVNNHYMVFAVIHEMKGVTLPTLFNKHQPFISSLCV